MYQETACIKCYGPRGASAASTLEPAGRGQPVSTTPHQGIGSMADTHIHKHDSILVLGHGFSSGSAPGSLLLAPGSSVPGFGLEDGANLILYLESSVVS